MEKKLVRIGSSWGVIIPPPLLKSIGIDPKTDNVLLTFDGKSITITPAKKETAKE